MKTNEGYQRFHMGPRPFDDRKYGILAEASDLSYRRVSNKVKSHRKHMLRALGAHPTEEPISYRFTFRRSTSRPKAFNDSVHLPLIVHAYESHRSDVSIEPLEIAASNREIQKDMVKDKTVNDVTGQIGEYLEHSSRPQRRNPVRYDHYKRSRAKPAQIFLQSNTQGEVLDSFLKTSAITAASHDLISSSNQQKDLSYLSDISTEDEDSEESDDDLLESDSNDVVKNPASATKLNNLSSVITDKSNKKSSKTNRSPTSKTKSSTQHSDLTINATLPAITAKSSPKLKYSPPKERQVSGFTNTKVVLQKIDDEVTNAVNLPPLTVGDVYKELDPFVRQESNVKLHLEELPYVGHGASSRVLPTKFYTLKDMAALFKEKLESQAPMQQADKYSQYVSKKFTEDADNVITSNYDNFARVQRTENQTNQVNKSTPKPGTKATARSDITLLKSDMLHHHSAIKVNRGKQERSSLLRHEGTLVEQLRREDQLMTKFKVAGSRESSNADMNDLIRVNNKPPSEQNLEDMTKAFGSSRSLSDLSVNTSNLRKRIRRSVSVDESTKPRQRTRSKVRNSSSMPRN